MPDLVRQCRIFLLEDETIVRTLMVEALRAQPRFAVIGEASDIPEALQLLHSGCVPDVLIADLILPSGDGTMLARDVLQRFPDVKVLILTSRTDESSLLRALRAGVHGFVHKRDPLDQLLAAIHAVANGQLAYNASARGLLKQMKVDGSLPAAQTLTPREESILALLARGKSHKEIAALTGISPHTAKTHCRNLMAKLDVHDRASLTRCAISRGMV